VYVDREGLFRTRREQTLSFSEKVLERMLAEGASEDEAGECARRTRDCQYFDADRLNIQFADEGMILRVGSEDFTVVKTEGHTVGHQGLFHERSGVMVSGDQILFVVSPCIDMSLNGRDMFALYVDGLERVKALGVSKLLISHGECRDDFVKRIDSLLGHLQRRLSEVLAIVSADPGMSGYQIIRAIRWNVPSWELSPILLRGIILFEGVAILDHLVNKGLLARQLVGTKLVYYPC
jgi:glyoxylase-like metal-dependent hydrolase (beta-lactamase superfamily II)